MITALHLLAAQLPAAVQPAILIRDASTKLSNEEVAITVGLTEEKAQQLRAGGRYIVSTIEGSIYLVVDREIDDIADLRANVAVLSTLKDGRVKSFGQLPKEAQEGLRRLLPNGDALEFRSTSALVLKATARINFVGPSGNVTVMSGLVTGADDGPDVLLRNPILLSSSAKPTDPRRGFETVYGSRLNGPDKKGTLVASASTQLAQILAEERKAAEVEFASYVKTIEDSNKRLLGRELLGKTGKDLDEMQVNFRRSYDGLTGNVGTYEGAVLTSIDVDIFVTYAIAMGDTPPRFPEMFPIGFMQR